MGLRMHNISLTIGAARILNDVSAAVGSGEIVGLIGPNGAGKSSLLRAALGLVRTDSGRVTLDDGDLASMPLKARAKKMAYAAQGAPVHWPLTVESMVALGRVPHLSPWQKPAREDAEAVAGALDRTDCSHLAERIVTTLSGGERARVMLARVLASGAPYILADEPVASLDPAHQLQVMDILRDHAHGAPGAPGLQGTDGKNGGVMVVLHDLGLAQRYCDRLVMLDRGRLIGQGSPHEMLSDRLLAQVFGIKAARWQDADGKAFLAPRQRQAD